MVKNVLSEAIPRMLDRHAKNRSRGLGWIISISGIFTGKCPKVFHVHGTPAYTNRVDKNTPIEETVGAMVELVK